LPVIVEVAAPETGDGEDGDELEGQALPHEWPEIVDEAELERGEADSCLPADPHAAVRKMTATHNGTVHQRPALMPI
jgi:hypothetical protein